MEEKEKFLEGIEKIGYTENGAIGYHDLDNPILNMQVRLPTYRLASEETIIKDFEKAFAYSKDLALKWLLFARDVRGGCGERRVFRVILRHLCSSHPALSLRIAALAPEYGRWDDVVDMLNVSQNVAISNIITAQLNADIANMKAGKSISLLAKWMPSVNAGNKSKVLANKYLKINREVTPKRYRQTLSALRRYLKVVEVNMSANMWEDIDYEAVPSRANLIYADAFMKHDEDRRSAYLENVQSGTAKMNSKANFPYNVIHEYAKDMEMAYWGEIDVTSIKTKPTVEAAWKALPNMSMERVLVVQDTSGSMSAEISGSLTALEVAQSLSIYFSERLTSAFKDKIVLFSSKPKFIDLSKCKSLLEKILTLYRFNECSNTNIESTFNLILRTAEANKLEQKDLPDTVLIVSDMEFDEGTYDNDFFMDRIEKRFKARGYKVPKLVFWNVASRTNVMPVSSNTEGAILVSGFSPMAAKMVFTGKTNPWEALLDVLNSERYNVKF